jgi:hypothetical protein
MKHHPASLRVAFLGASAILVPQASAAIVGLENFDYPDGPIADRTGGTGWTYLRTAEPGAPAQSPSDWDATAGVPSVLGGALITNGTGAKREFGGLTEGSAAGSNEREGAFRGSGSMYFRTTYSVDTLLAGGVNQWGGVSSYDFGTERIFFGMPGQTTTTRFFGISESGVGTTLSTIPIQANTTYTLVGMVDFDNDLLGLWVNPDGSDTPASFDASRVYTGTNWSTALRFASASGATVTWDNVTVADNFADVIPEASTSLLALLGAAGMLHRRRRI